MVIFAALETDVQEVTRDPVDELHHVKDSKRQEGYLIVKDHCGRDHVLAHSGTLYLWNIQCPENPIVKAIAGYHRLNGSTFVPTSFPMTREYDCFPTLFELERLAARPITLGIILNLNSDGYRDFEPDSSYFKEQEKEFKALGTWYAGAVATSRLGKPVLEGFYLGMKEKNVETLARANDHDRPPLGRQALLRLVLQEENFVKSFGENLYQRLREMFGEPRFS